MRNGPIVCNVQGPVKFPDQKIAAFQPIPKATDLPTALRAINAITQNFYNLSRAGNFREDRSLRTFETVRVFNPDNANQWVDVLQVTGVTFVDPVTGRTLIWRQ